MFGKSEYNMSYTTNPKATKQHEEMPTSTPPMEQKAED